jgi:hypothetical protein
MRGRCSVLLGYWAGNRPSKNLADPFRPSFFRLKIARDSIDAVGRFPIGDFAMRTGYPPDNKQSRLGVLLGAENVVPLRGKNASLQGVEHGDDNVSDVLSPLLEEVVEPQGDEPPDRGTTDVRPLMEKNARLRRLAVKLSNLLGDLPPFAIPGNSDTRRDDR